MNEIESFENSLSQIGLEVFDELVKNDPDPKAVMSLFTEIYLIGFEAGMNRFKNLLANNLEN
jgi:hypothetical protein